MRGGKEMHEVSEFLIKDYSNCTGDDCSNPGLRIVSLETLFDDVQAAKEDESYKVAVYAIGKCLLDWS